MSVWCLLHGWGTPVRYSVSGLRKVSWGISAALGLRLPPSRQRRLSGLGDDQTSRAGLSMAVFAKRLAFSMLSKVSCWLAPEGAKTMARYGKRSASSKNQVVFSHGSRGNDRPCPARRPRPVPALMAVASPVAAAAGASSRSSSYRFSPTTKVRSREAAI